MAKRKGSTKRAAKKKPAAKRPDPFVVETQVLVALWFDVSIDTVARSWRKKGMPGVEGAWPLQEIARWLAKQYGKRDSASAAAASKARAFQLRQQGEFARLKKERLQGQLVELAQVQLEVSEALILTSDQLLLIPTALLPILPADKAADLTQEFERRIRNCLVMLKDQLTAISSGELADDEDNDGEP